MRVISGEAKSLPLKTPPGNDTRPTTDRIKETLFNMLQHQLADIVFADIFSGSGGIGIEAISRGAKKAYFIEKDKAALSCIRENLNFTKLMNRGVILGQDAKSAFCSIEEPLDIIFMDPPYHTQLNREMLLLFKGFSVVTSDTLIIIEMAIDEDTIFIEQLGFEIVKEKKYKTNKHVFLYKKNEE